MRPWFRVALSSAPVIGALLLSILADPAAAQRWKAASDGRLGFAAASISEGRLLRVSLSCTMSAYSDERWLAETGSFEAPMPRRPGFFALEIPDAPFRALRQLVLTSPQSVMTSISVDGARVWRAAMESPVLAALTGYVRDGDPLIAALKRGATADVLVEPTGERLRISLGGSSRAIASLETWCRNDWARDPAVTDAAVQGGGGAVSVAAAEAFGRRLCGGEARFADGYAREAFIDGDDAPDVLIDTGALLCANGMRGAGACGAALCAQYVALSSAPDPFESPPSFLSIPVETVSRGAGRADLVLRTGRGEYRMRWTGDAFTRIGGN